MRVFLFIVVVLVLMGLLGWIQFHRTAGRASITVETQTIENDLQKTADVVRDKTKETLQEFKAPVAPPKASPRPQ